MENIISQVRARLKSVGTYPSEAAVKNGIVLPILSQLNWDTTDIDTVIPEYSIEGRRVDFALCYPKEKPVIFVEVKQLGLLDGAERQLFEYASYIGIRLAILTDGRIWNFYLPSEQGNFRDRLYYRFDIVDTGLNEIVERLNLYLVPHHYDNCG